MLRQAHGWQVLLADLSLILFITTAAALAQGGDGIAVSAGTRDVPPAAVYRMRSDADPARLRDWISAYTPDPRESLGIVIHFRPAQFDQALIRARRLMEQAQASGHVPRITFEEGGQEDTIASFGFAGNPAMAHKLLEPPVS